MLPGERAPALPGFVAYTVEVRDLDAARRVLRRNEFPVTALPSGDLLSPPPRPSAPRSSSARPAEPTAPARHLSKESCRATRF